jgi:glutathione S-transferase
MSLTLVIGNKNYSSWSMRPWVLLKQFGIPFEEIMLKFESKDWNDRIARVAPSLKVPTLWDGEVAAATSLAVWETVAIIEYIADKFPQLAIWPRDVRARAMARAITAEMHAGFQSMRSNMPMNIRSQHPGKGMNAAVAADIARIEAIWSAAREQFGSHTNAPFLFGQFCAADAMFAPVVMRFATYAPTISGASQRYGETLKAAQGVAAWIADAHREAEFVAFDEPYATAPK